MGVFCPSHSWGRDWPPTLMIVCQNLLLLEEPPSFKGVYFHLPSAQLRWEVEGATGCTLSIKVALTMLGTWFAFQRVSVLSLSYACLMNPRLLPGMTKSLGSSQLVVVLFNLSFHAARGDSTYNCRFLHRQEESKSFPLEPFV